MRAPVRFYRPGRPHADASTATVAHVGGGIGGGGVLVPLYVVCWGFQTEHAVALSNLTIAGGAFANLMCNVSRCAQTPLLALARPDNPQHERPCIPATISLCVSVLASHCDQHRQHVCVGGTRQRIGRSLIGTSSSSWSP